MSRRPILASWQGPGGGEVAKALEASDRLVALREARDRGDQPDHRPRRTDLPQEAVRIAPAPDARTLIDTVPAGERVTWATAFYAGLRRGELQALRCKSIDLGKSVIHVEHSWDQEAGEIEPKSATSVRTVPLLAILRDHLDEHLLATGRGGDTLCSAGRPPTRSYRRRSWPERTKRGRRRSWSGSRSEQCRHTFASLLIASGENPKAVQEFMGHSTITITFDLYGTCSPAAATRLEPHGRLPRNRVGGRRRRGPWESDGKRCTP